jgi:hypothetical protein
MLKRVVIILVVVFVIFNVSLLVYTASRCWEKTIHLEANVLSIDEHILEGNLIGRFLSSPSGSLRNDVIKVGVAFEINGHLFLKDLRLEHAELAYYREQTTIPLVVHIRLGKVDEVGFLRIYLHGRHVRTVSLTPNRAHQLLKDSQCLQQL